ncbi:MAG: hypothetical protein D6698_06830 [Gammaproteobacteria bacterium]|nr:MAG: hypothetical protein D6698_06830 [Gammaproteobacteria bacterium]
MKLGPLLGISAAAFYLLYSIFHEEEEEFISPSLLGKRGKSLFEALIREEEDDALTKNLLSSGTYIHQLVEEELGNIADSEVEVVASDVGVRGFVDVMLSGGIPVEVKTISDTGFDNLAVPIDAHVSQINAYLHANKVSYGYLMYLDAQNPRRRKIFTVTYEPGRLLADIQAVREAIMSSTESMPADRIAWLTQHFQTSPGYFKGIRQSRGSAASFHTMKPHAEFPNGRVASIVQASRYRSLGSAKSTEPTMGLTIHLHERAKHGVKRCNHSTPVYNGSRYNRQC